MELFDSKFTVIFISSIIIIGVFFIFVVIDHSVGDGKIIDKYIRDSGGRYLVIDNGEEIKDYFVNESVYYSWDIGDYYYD